ncbi:MAG: hypothetical protein JNN24_17380 [Hyphomicrobium zavarzinii]|uniref:hypothetical protein n=1 Tax=Hyphomicrobium zavarzinii TaxID=48292 RepID=UPI001A524CD8|nr:hypothetical protein [Hyphomicrobium zavarzinii]MBL8847539.1 hypothetical protein [Hyphomicrobium zavarzinii]
MGMFTRGVAFLIVCFLAWAEAAAGAGDAGKGAPPPAAAEATVATDPKAGAASGQGGEVGAASGVPDVYKLNLLIRTTIIALNQANATGNYSVLRDLAAPGFQEANNPARLAEIFAQVRGRNLDLSPILFFEPKLVRPPAIQANGHLRLSGYFETLPERVSFDLAFERSEKDWKLFGIAIEVAAPPPSQSATATGEPPGQQVSPLASSPKDAKSNAEPKAPSSKAESPKAQKKQP